MNFDEDLCKQHPIVPHPLCPSTASNDYYADIVYTDLRGLVSYVVFPCVVTHLSVTFVTVTHLLMWQLSLLVTLLQCDRCYWAQARGRCHDVRTCSQWDELVSQVRWGASKPDSENHGGHFTVVQILMSWQPRNSACTLTEIIDESDTNNFYVGCVWWCV